MSLGLEKPKLISMFGFGWVRTHLGVVFGDAFGVFKVFGWISRKMGEMSKIWASSGVLRHGVVTLCNSVGLRQGGAWPCCGVAEMEDLASLRYAACYAAA